MYSEPTSTARTSDASMSNGSTFVVAQLRVQKTAIPKRNKKQSPEELQYNKILTQARLEQIALVSLINSTDECQGVSLGALDFSLANGKHELGCSSLAGESK